MSLAPRYILQVGLTAEFPNLGIPKELAKFCSVIPRKKWLFPIHSDFNEIPTELCHLNGKNIFNL